MAKELILAVDDEEDILALVEYNLSKEGYRVEKATTGEAALMAARARTPGLILLDLMLPGLDGLEVCRSLKVTPATARVPIIMLTAKGEEADIVTGLELGADDYVTKPFSPKVLIARVRAALRRNRAVVADEAEPVSIGDITVDPGRHQVSIEGQLVDLTLTEFRLLHALARRPGWVFTRYQIVELTRGGDSEVTDRSVDVHIVSLRRKLGAAGDRIETVRGVGYRFKEEQ